jgi:DNA topoisomerase-1
MSCVPASLTAPPGLVYVQDDGPGISRRRRGKGFAYRQPDGSALRDAQHLARIRALAIPPAYTQVWICTRPDGHLQATGRDARGRKQYRYHPAWREAQDAGKYERLLAFADALPRIRRVVQRDMGAARGPHVERSAVLAAVVRLLDTTLVRVGNDSYARSNGSFGLTTLRNRHAELKGSRLKLHFKGKSGVQHEVTVDDPRVALIVRRCQALPGQQLFQYLEDDGTRRSIDSADVNDYLRQASGGDFTAKDFRTWHGSVQALALAAQQPFAADITLTARRSQAKAMLSEVAQRLGNTVAVCRKAYVHPDVLAVLAGDEGSRSIDGLTPLRKAGLTADERRLLAFIAAAATPAGAAAARRRRR